jgi:hypothetical protein
MVGWLVCVTGGEAGRDYRIQSGTNSIGRSPSNRIAVNDASVANDQHASIVFDAANATFHLRPGWSRGLVFVNDKLVLNPLVLKSYDKITLGQSTFVFVPLCGDRFGWPK